MVKAGIKELDNYQIDLGSLQAASPQIYKQASNLVDLFVKYNQIGKISDFDWNLYAYGKDYHSKKFLIVIEAKYYGKKKDYDFPLICQGYFLLGKNEDNTLFVYRIDKRVIFNAIKNEKDIILSVQSRIFRFDYKKLFRQGNIFLIPLGRKLKGFGELESDFASQHRILGDNQNLYCDRLITEGGKIYAFNPILEHATLPEISCEGWVKVQVLDNFKGRL